MEPEGKESAALVNLIFIVSCRSSFTEGGTKEAFETVFRTYADGAAQAFARQFTVQKLIDFEGKFQLPAKVCRQENLLAFFEQNYSELSIAGERLKSYICANFPGKRGTGVYTDEQERIYAKIQQMLQAQHFVAVGSGTNLGSAKGKIAGTNEHQVKGLAGPHAYQVVGLAKMRDTEVKFLRLRNPWLNYVRGYSWKQAAVQGQQVRVLSAAEVQQAPQLDALKLEAPVDLGAGEFLLELSDLTKRFTKLFFATGHGQALPDLGNLQHLVA